jgi:RNA polymerase sigma-70 factor (ECF subfamily)
MYLRKSKKVVLFEQLEEHIPAPEKPVDTVDALELLNAISHLEPMLQTIIFLRFYEDMKLEEIARATDANLNTVKSRLYKALRLLKLDMGEDE